MKDDSPFVRKVKKQYIVGDKSQGADYTVEEIELLILRIRDWFSSDECDRQYPDPFEAAKAKVKECLLAQTADGAPWKVCPDKFEDRIKTKCLFNIATGKGVKAMKNKSPRAKELEKEAAAGAKAVNKIKQKPDFDVEDFKAKVEVDVLEEFPELDNPAHRPNVRRLAALYAQQELLDWELGQEGLSLNKRETAIKLMRIVGQDADTTMNILGIHPNQLQRSLAKKTGSAVSELIKILDDDNDFKERTKKWGLQLALQLYYMSQHYNGRKDGPQMEDWEIWHMTRSRPIKYRCQCGKEVILVEGFEPSELRDYLIKEGVLITEPALPILFSEADIQGIDTADLGHTHDEGQASSTPLMSEEDLAAAVQQLMEEDDEEADS